VGPGGADTSKLASKLIQFVNLDRLGPQASVGTSHRAVVIIASRLVARNFEFGGPVEAQATRSWRQLEEVHKCAATEI